MASHSSRWCALRSATVRTRRCARPAASHWRSFARWWSTSAARRTSSSSSPTPAPRYAGLPLQQRLLSRMLHMMHPTLEPTQEGQGLTGCNCTHTAQFSQSGDGHFSPIGAYHPGTDQVLILDTVRTPSFPPSALIQAHPLLGNNVMHTTPRWQCRRVHSGNDRRGLVWAGRPASSTPRTGCRWSDCTLR